MSDSETKRDPIKGDLLPLPGEGLSDSLRKRLAWVAFVGGILVGVLASLVIVMLLQAGGYIPWPPVWNWIVSVTLVLAYLWLRKLFGKLVRQTDNELLGLRGERYVGQMLEGLRSRGYVPLHDLMEVAANGARYNIDHVLIGPAGIFVIETKTRNKPNRGSPQIEYDGSAVKVGSSYRDEKPIKQALRNAESVRQILGRGIDGSEPPIQPVVIFPGWYVQPNPPGCRVWVLHENAFPGWLKRSVLSSDEIDYYVGRLIGRRTVLR